MEAVNRKAIVIGGTGATGRELVRQLLVDTRFSAVTALVRKPYFNQHPKLREMIVDFEQLESYQEHIRGDVAFSCLGTTLKDAGGKDAQWRVDHDYQLKFAAIAREQQIPAFILLSAAGADHKAFIFYSRMKGTLENHIKVLGFGQFTVLRPGAIDRPDTTRTGEKWMVQMIKALNRIGLLRSYEAISTRRLARAMVAAYFAFPETVKIVSLTEIKGLSD